MMESMSHSTLFLDTNIYLGYALDKRFEKYHFQCCHILEKQGLSRHTCVTVKGELEKKLRERKKLYQTLLKHCLSGKQLKQFSIAKIAKNERNHTEDIIAQSHKDGKSDMEYVRSLDRLFYARVIDALVNKTTHPLVCASSDAYMKSDMATLGIHPPDDCILTDFFTWALPGNGSSFMTGDNKIYDMRTRITDIVERLIDVSHFAFEESYICKNY